MGNQFSLTFDEEENNGGSNSNGTAAESIHDSNANGANNTSSEGNNSASFFDRLFQYGNYNNSNNRQSFVNITEEELEVRRKQRETEKVKVTENENEKLKRHHSAILIQKHWKGFSQRKKYSLFLTKIQVFKELLLTERDYIQFLEIIIRVYSNPLKNLAVQCQQSKKESLPKPQINGEALGQSVHEVNLDEAPLTLDEVKIVFSQIEVILLYNSQLFEKLRSRLLINFVDKYNNHQKTIHTQINKSLDKSPVSEGNGSNKLNTSMTSLLNSKNSVSNITIPEGKNSIGFYQEIGDIFLEMIDFLKVPYSHYIINFPMCLKVLENAAKRPAFMLFTQQCKSIPEVGRRDLQSFVSMPIQRIPRYVLLLRELLKFTVPGHSDHTNIELAVKRMEDIANLINRQMKEDETSKEVFQISQKIRPSIPNLVEPHRKIIKEGMVKIHKVDGNTHDNEVSSGTIRPNSILSLAKGSSKYIFLFNDLFVITRKKKTHYQLDKIVNLEYSTIIDNYKIIKILQQEKEQKKVGDASDSDSESSVTSSSSASTTPVKHKSTGSGSTPTSPNTSGSATYTTEKKGERFYFKLHTLDTSIVICCETEAEKDSWKNSFITVINKLTENSLSFNPKWSRNDLIYGEDRQRRPSVSKRPMSMINPDNFTLTKSIAELLSLSKPIKGMNDQKSSNNPVNNEIKENSQKDTSSTNNSNSNSGNGGGEQNQQQPPPQPPPQNSKDTNGEGGRSRSTSISAGFTGTFERILQAIKS